MITSKSSVAPKVMIAIGGIALLAGLFSFSVSGGLAAFLILGGLIVLFLGISINAANKVAQAEKYVSYDEATSSLTLNERNPAIRNGVSLVADNNIPTAYEPEAINYTSVTVGGVTTGGAYKTGGYNYISSTKKNGLYRMTYGKSSIIGTIQLDESLFQLAKSSPIAPYLNEKSRLL